MRPYVLWFDECYDEPRFRCESSLDAAERAALLVVVGTSGSFLCGPAARELPALVEQLLARHRA
jgi:NAD-dependent SIR2 family protein deacetylase